MSAIYWSYDSECAVCADEPPSCTCEACGQEYYNLYGCDTCEDCRRAA